MGRVEALTALAEKLPKLLACFAVDDPSIVLRGARPSSATANGWAGSPPAAMAAEDQYRHRHPADPGTASPAEDIISGSF